MIGTSEGPPVDLAAFCEWNASLRRAPVAHRRQFCETNRFFINNNNGRAGRTTPHYGRYDDTDSSGKVQLNAGIRS